MSWIPWNGGECPVPEATLVDVKHRDGKAYIKILAGHGVTEDWSHEDNPRDIIEYRIHNEQNNNS